MNTEEFKSVAKTKEKKSPTLKNCVFAFIIGGTICVLGQALYDMYTGVLNLEADIAQVFSSISLIFLSALFTGIGLYDKIAKIAGAGTLVPITGFANAMSSAAMEFKSEGIIFGTSVKMFSIVGPVVVNGIVWSTVAGLLHLIIFGRFGA